MFESKLIKTIPGILAERPNSEKQGFIQSLSSKTKPELIEIFERQKDLLSNKSFMNKLPDKGEKIKLFHNKVSEELSKKDSVDLACSMLSNLDIASNTSTLNNLEWGTKEPEQYLDSDDDIEPIDPLKIIARSTQSHRIVKVQHQPKPLLTEKDIEDIESFKAPEHVKYVIHKSEDSEKVVRGSFKPYKTTKTNVHDPAKEAGRKHHRYWENTAATHPASKHGPAKMLTLQDSLVLQTKQAQHLKEVELKHATAKLAEQLGLPSGVMPLHEMVPGPYRKPILWDSDSDQHEDSDNEVHDDDDQDLKGTIAFDVAD